MQRMGPATLSTSKVEGGTVVASISLGKFHHDLTQINGKTKTTWMVFSGNPMNMDDLGVAMFQEISTDVFLGLING